MVDAKLCFVFAANCGPNGGHLMGKLMAFFGLQWFSPSFDCVWEQHCLVGRCGVLLLAIAFDMSAFAFVI